MILRTVFLAAVCAVPFLGGCSTGGRTRHVDAPPPFKFENGKRFNDECAWFYAAVQDTFFGVDYYDHIETRFGGTLYD